ncbi:RICIN domain-containing protein [Catenulispora sp. NF23]|uniref:RICIN domain-containing protein n=1 Tax=Catenulispora pinistramenti TaxID=2705254 RepID=UPI001BAE4475|nr:RICIN domain-containing protein [Catenulispora pinistramenti]MBS2535720.1 RICIN domain-containing protein [Catenulispora pinistramenti]
MSEGSNTTGGVRPVRVPRAVRCGRGSGAAVSSAVSSAVLVAVIVAGAAACSSGAGSAGASAAAGPSLTTTGTVTGTTTIAEPVPASSAGAPSSNAPAAPPAPATPAVPSKSPHSAATPPPHPSPSLSMGPAALFENTHSGQCLGRTSDAPGTPVSTAACGTAASLGWTIASDGTIRVGGLCMDATGTQGGALVQLAACGTDPGTDPGEQFVFSDGELVGTRAAKCVDDEFKGTQVRLQRCDASTAQIWRHL